MRTTLSLDDDLARQIKERASLEGETVVGSETFVPPYVVKAKACGFRPGVDPLKLNQLVDELEIEHFRGKLLMDLASRWINPLN